MTPVSDSPFCNQHIQCRQLIGQAVSAEGRRLPALSLPCLTSIRSELTICPGDFDAVGGGDELGAALHVGEAVAPVALQVEAGARVEGVLAAGVAAVERVADEAADSLGDCKKQAGNVSPALLAFAISCISC